MHILYVNYKKYKNEIKKIYYNSFPKIERFPFWILSQTSSANKAELKAIINNNQVIGFYYIVNCDELNYLMYFSIEENMRNKNYGSNVLYDLKSNYKILFLSIEKPNDNLSIRRKAFYLRNGFYETNKYYEDNGVTYEILCTDKNYIITETILKKRYSNMSNSKLMKYIISKIFNMTNVKFID